MGAPEFDDDDAKDRFWAGGCEEFERALAQRYEAMIDDMRAQIAGATSDVERKALKLKLAEVEAEYARKLENIGRSLF